MSLKDTGIDFLSGGAGGLCLLAVGHPFDTIKVRVQTKPEIYGGALNALKMTIRESPLAVYKGVGALIPGIAPVFALSFTGYEHGKLIFGNESALQFGLAGCFAAIYTTPLIAPGERIKCVAQTTDKYGKSVGEVLKNVYKEGGVKFLSRGAGLTLARDGLGGAFYFGVYETLKQTYMKKNNLTDFPVLPNLICGGMGGSAMWLFVMPLDVVKSRVQIAPIETTPSMVYKQVLSDFKVKGLGTIYRGLGVAMMRAFPANAACFVGYEKSKKFLKNWL